MPWSMRQSPSLTDKELFETLGYDTRAAGIYSDVQPLTWELLNWADRVFVFEEQHLKFIRDNGPDMA